MANVVMPRVAITPGVEKGTIDVTLTKPGQINAGNPSAFPLAEDKFKGLHYQTASESMLNSELAEYYAILNRIMAGTSTNTDLNNLEALTAKIREYVLTDDDYNLVIGSLQNMQTYILKFMYNDISNKAKAMDDELNKVINDVNRFMTDLETTYSKSPSQYPIPDGSVFRTKMEQEVQNTLNYTDATRGVIVSTTKPANPSGKPIIWFNIGNKL